MILITIIAVACAIACVITGVKYYKLLHTSPPQEEVQIPVLSPVEIEELEKRLELLRKAIKQSEEESVKTNNKRIHMSELLNIIQDDYVNLQHEVMDYNKRISDTMMQHDNLVQKINECAKKSVETQQALESLTAQFKEATRRTIQNDNGRIMTATTKEKELLAILNQLKDEHPQLCENFNQIIWTKIWQPKFQSMTVDLLKKDVCGIYRIFTIDEDGFCRSYVGQAKKIRDRWSQHIKKMIGIDKSDNAKFYSYVSPDIAHFEIIEECKESELNEREHFWISFYNCVEDGYNSKN